MKHYQSHKIVEAAPIDRIERGSEGLSVVWVAVDTGMKFDPVRVPDDFFGRGEPGRGDYLVRYAPDGYLSWSPKAAFESGYTPVIMDRDPTWQERSLMELQALGVRISALWAALLAGTVTDPKTVALMREQLNAMRDYHAALQRRLRHCGVIDLDTPLEEREGSGEAAMLGASACVEVTVSAPAGKRAVVKVFHTDEGYDGPHSDPMTVTEGQSQSLSISGSEVVTISQADTSTVAHKRETE